VFRSVPQGTQVQTLSPLTPYCPHSLMSLLSLRPWGLLGACLFFPWRLEAQPVPPHPPLWSQPDHPAQARRTSIEKGDGGGEEKGAVVEVGSEVQPDRLRGSPGNGVSHDHTSPTSLSQEVHMELQDQ
jgi:hypothetical protein